MVNWLVGEKLEKFLAWPIYPVRLVLKMSEDAFQRVFCGVKHCTPDPCGSLCTDSFDILPGASGFSTATGNVTLTASAAATRYAVRAPSIPASRRTITVKYYLRQACVYFGY